MYFLAILAPATTLALSLALALAALVLTWLDHRRRRPGGCLPHHDARLGRRVASLVRYVARRGEPRLAELLEAAHRRWADEVNAGCEPGEEVHYP